MSAGALPLASFAQGVDVSRFQSHVDWAQVQKAGMAFAFARALDIAGGTAGDSQFAANWPGIAAVGLRRGAYCFLRVNHDPAQQAEVFLNLVGGMDPMDLPPVLDIEEIGVQGFAPQQILDAAQTWLDTVQNALGKRPIVYTDQNTLTAFLKDSTALAGYPLWQAAYRSSPPPAPKGWHQWTFWQHSAKGSVLGITGDVDLDYFRGSAADLDAFIQGSNLASTPPGT